VLGLRLAWMFAVPTLVSPLRRRRGGDPPSAATRLVLGWSGMRGGVSLALALAVPASAAGDDRALVVFLAFVTIVVTLVAPGFTLAPLIGRLGLRQEAVIERQEDEARYRITHAGLERLDELEQEGWVHDDVVARLRATFEARLDVLARTLSEETESPPAAHDDQQVRREVVAAQRRTLDELRRERAFPAEVLEAVREDLDLLDTRLS
jgi:monovalent cation/hydrogen antiporter